MNGMNAYNQPQVMNGYTQGMTNAYTTGRVTVWNPGDGIQVSNANFTQRPETNLIQHQPNVVGSGIWTTGTGQFVSGNSNNGMGNNLSSSTNVNQPNSTFVANEGKDTLFTELTKNKSFRKRASESGSESVSSHGSATTVSTFKEKKDKKKKDSPTNSPPKEPEVEIIDEEAAEIKQRLDALFESGEIVNQANFALGFSQNMTPYPEYRHGLNVETRTRSLPSTIQEQSESIE